jgi:hypothetical protein
LALLMPLSTRFFMRKRFSSLTFTRQFAIHFVSGCFVLVAGLMVFGRDGKMLTYVAVVLANATCQWVIQRGHRST